MRPGARVGAVIEILQELEKTNLTADRVVTSYTRSRRYIGSKDRREIGNLVFSILRSKLRLTWWLERAGHAEISPRALAIASLSLQSGQTQGDVPSLFSGEGYGPPELTSKEETLIEALSGSELVHPDQPDWVRDEVVPWLHPRLLSRFGSNMAAEMAALQNEADVVLRVNRLKGTRSGAQKALAQEDVATRETAMAPLGLRVEGRRSLRASRAFRDGLIEVQDEGSQLVALLCDAAPGMAVADYCAGAGGKTLALAAEMQGKGRITALDSDAKRLERAGPRLERAGVQIVELKTLPDDSWTAKSAGSFDRVLVDAPCSGSGVWRRQPDARLALTPKRFEGYLQAQRAVLQSASLLVRRGGRLIYATCSLLPEEDEQQVEAFLAANPDFSQLILAEVWNKVLPDVACPAEGFHLLLTPRQHGTDGFFVSILERRLEDT
ncbi:RsmB/NOP family class I SAM-dependent RNA methyltransferase [Denitrobaculum tricleocarpae]|uniref:RsmB/NOP family class I SAM-dependent RNA methyltransferase n=1 Tax=Denitrobaculum tricleocarpae TaxID=2591009 RepID=A0A545TU26_9PROT|nr:RsmB/NOP family class I SAM-dependent RNA methyltransferase [Denitrobaculum tricleocarpae]TQV80716.1 RsmB/NOP family class I SAM-dependent RNA methyltransferase [Denitrobaculum tricleocarpae]